MSSVISVVTYSERPWRDGLVKRRYEVVLEDNNLVQTTHIVGPVKVLPADDGTADADRLLNGLLEREEYLVRNVSDPLALTLSPEWSTTKRVAKHALYWMIREKDPYIVIYLKPLIQHIQANFTAPQIATLLDLTTDQVLALNRRVNAILTDTGTAETLLAAYDAEQDEELNV